MKMETEQQESIGMVRTGRGRTTAGWKVLLDEKWNYNSTTEIKMISISMKEVRVP